MRLCIDARMLYSSGIGTFLQNLIPFLAKDPFEVILLCQKPYQSYMSSRFTSKVYSVAEQIVFPWKVPPCDLFWSPHYNVPVFPIKARRRVVTIHDVCHLAQPFPLIKRMAARFLLQNACKRSDQITTVSLFSQSEISKYLGVAKEKIRVIPPGVNTQEFSPNLGAPKAPFFLFVGHLKGHKNFIALLKAFDRLRLKDYRLVIVGKAEGLGSSDPSLYESIKKNPLNRQIDLLGEISKPKLQKLYASATALVFPSLYEGFGLPPLEAMASGCPVIASRSASIPEVCGEAALYFDPQSFQELAKQMERVASDKFLQEHLIQKGFQRSSLFSWESTADGYRSLFLSLKR